MLEMGAVIRYAEIEQIFEQDGRTAVVAMRVLGYGESLAGPIIRTIQLGEFMHRYYVPVSERIAMKGERHA